jgi:vacuolar protein sorting-associated protein 13A/C
VLELPVEVVAGTIGRLSLKIPWSSLASSPVVVTMEDVYLLALPLSHRSARLLQHVST